MKVKSGLIAVIATVGMASTAQADVTIPLSGTYTGTWANVQTAYTAGDLIGTLTSVSIDALFSGQLGGTWASDIGVIVGFAAPPYPSGGGGIGLLQVGGFSNSNAAERLANWGGPGQTTADQQIIASYNLLNPIVFAGDGSDPNVYFGNLWNSAGSSATWNGTITLHGVNLVPAPGALALLGLAGLVGTRRRRD